MGSTQKSELYRQCAASARNAEAYKGLYKRTTLCYWAREYRRLTAQYVYKAELVKAALRGLPVELYFKIKSHLYLNDFKE